MIHNLKRTKISRMFLSVAFYLFFLFVFPFFFTLLIFCFLSVPYLYISSPLFSLLSFSSLHFTHSFTVYGQPYTNKHIYIYLSLMFVYMCVCVVYVYACVCARAHIRKYSNDFNQSRFKC